MNDYKNKIIMLLKKEQNKKFKEFFLQKISSLSEQDLNDLYFLLTTTDKNKIFQYSREKSKELKNQSFKLEQIGIKAKKIIGKYGEFQDKKQEDINIDILLSDL